MTDYKAHIEYQEQRYNALVDAVKVMLEAQKKWDASKSQRDLPALFAAKNAVNKLLHPEPVKQSQIEWINQ